MFLKNIDKHTACLLLYGEINDEPTQLTAKGTIPTDINQARYKGIKIKVFSQWPESLMVATLCNSGRNGNLFAAVNPQDDENVIQIDKWKR